VRIGTGRIEVQLLLRRFVSECGKTQEGRRDRRLEENGWMDGG
jgi:hypothetical protein